jgi:hypothetical protein|tara:strand:+ start:221 stop:940 length:720 start_codon:yes stop_codon:yes gene_type:complete
MATTTATLSLESSDLLSNILSFSTIATLTDAGGSTGITQAQGLTRKTTSAAAAGNIQAEILFRGDDVTTNGANKVYLKNISTTAAEYFTIHIDGEELGRLYAGDWAFFPWNATAGTKASFTLTIAATWAANDTWEFDGITMTAANSTTSAIAAQIDGLNYPNWTTDHGTGESTIAFTARQSGGLTRSTAVTLDGTLNTAGNGTADISGGAAGTGKSESDISIRPSVHTAMTMEHLLFHE